MRLKLLVTSLLVLYQRADCNQNSSNTLTGTRQEKLSAALISLAERIQDISPCQEPVVAFEDEMRGITLELSGVKDDDNTKFTQFLSHVFNMRKSVVYSCILITATARDMMSRVEDIDTFIDRITNYSGKIKNKMLRMTDTKLQQLANRTVNHLEEIKGELESTTEYLAMISKDSYTLGNKMRYLYTHGPQINMKQRRSSTKYVPFYESMLASVDLVHDRNHKKDVKKQMKSFQKAMEFGVNEKSKIQEKLNALEEKKQKIKEILEEPMNSGITVDQSHLILKKLQNVKKVLGAFLNIKDEVEDEVEDKVEDQVEDQVEDEEQYKIEDKVEADNNEENTNMEENDKVEEMFADIIYYYD